MPGLLRRFSWPKSMRWGGTSGFTWVRPLRRIVCLLDGAVVPFDLRDGAVTAPPAYVPIACFPVRIDDGVIYTRDDR